MSQLAPARPLPRTSPRRLATSTPRQLKVVAPREGEGNGAFLALCVLLLLGGFVGVLVLNTAMAKGSYTLRDLQHRSDELTDSQDSLRHSIDAVSGPGPLAKRARDLGMVPAETAAFLRLSDGKILGVARKAKANSTFSVVTETTAPTRSTPVPRTAVPVATPPDATPNPRASGVTSPGPTASPATPTPTSATTPTTRTTPTTPTPSTTTTP